MSPFESPWILAGAAVAALVIGLARVLPRTKVGGLAVVVGAVLLGVAAFLLDAYVETDREQIDTALETIVTDFAANDAAAVQQAIDPGALVWRAAASAAVALVDLDDGYRLTDISTDVDGASASQHFRLNGRFSVGRFGDVGHQPTRWRLDWTKTPDGWLIEDVHELDPITGEELNRGRKILGVK